MVELTLEKVILFHPIIRIYYLLQNNLSCWCELDMITMFICDIEIIVLSLFHVIIVLVYRLILSFSYISIS